MARLDSVRDIGSVVYGVLSDDHARRSREEFTLPAGNKVKNGGIVTAGGVGEMVPWTAGQPFGGIVLWDTDATDAAKPVAVLVREFNLLKEGLLNIALRDITAPAPTQGDIDTLLADIAANHSTIIVRDAVDA